MALANRKDLERLLAFVYDPEFQAEFVNKVINKFANDPEATHGIIKVTHGVETAECGAFSLDDPHPTLEFFTSHNPHPPIEQFAIETFGAWHE